LWTYTSSRVDYMRIAPYIQVSAVHYTIYIYIYIYIYISYPLKSVTQDRGFEHGRSRRIFRAKKSTACLPSEGK
jgi:hypothetical protein